MRRWAILFTLALGFSVLSTAIAGAGAGPASGEGDQARETATCDSPAEGTGCKAVRQQSRERVREQSRNREEACRKAPDACDAATDSERVQTQQRIMERVMIVAGSEDAGHECRFAGCWILVNVVGPLHALFFEAGIERGGLGAYD